tara:strand:+ start:1025 stop:1528 length:504 start_codon:yes stop_codon:yes gene_type:complete
MSLWAIIVVLMVGVVIEILLYLFNIKNVLGLDHISYMTLGIANTLLVLNSIKHKKNLLFFFIISAGLIFGTVIYNNVPIIFWVLQGLDFFMVIILVSVMVQKVQITAFPVSILITLVGIMVSALMIANKVHIGFLIPVFIAYCVLIGFLHQARYEHIRKMEELKNQN